MQYRDEFLPSLISPTSASYTNSIARLAVVSIVITPTFCPQTLRRTLYISSPLSRSETWVHHRPRFLVRRCKQPARPYTLKGDAHCESHYRAHEF